MQNKNWLIVGAIGVGVGLVINRKRKNKPKKNNKKPNKKKRSKNKKERFQVTEKGLKDYELSPIGKLNKYEKKFLKFLRQSDPKANIIVKQREPKMIGEGVIEYAYLIKYVGGEIYLVTPKIVDELTLSYAIHEVCHHKEGHQDSTDPDFYLETYEKEYQVEDCVINFFEENDLYYKPRKRRNIKRIYQ